MNRLHLFVVIASFVSFASVAEAKRHSREGFNFGLGVRAIGSSDATKGADNNADSKKDVSSQAFTPHLGYVFLDTINVGLSGYFENESVEEHFKSKDGSQEIHRDSESSIKGGNLYMRFMFANYMHFEGGVGIYDRRIKVSDEYTSRNGDGTFSGERDEYSVRGIGPGYHAGVGLEIPVVQGFFVSSDFMIRSIQLRDRGNESVGKKRSHVDKRELTFGISHYID